MERTPDEVASECVARLATLSQGELEALAEYRTHKGCCCEKCRTARKVLARMDAVRDATESWTPALPEADGTV
jgi:hypothetical protein